MAVRVALESFGAMAIGLALLLVLGLIGILNED